VSPVLLHCFPATHLSFLVWEKYLCLQKMKLNGKDFMLKRIGFVHIIPFLTLFHKNELEWEDQNLRGCYTIRIFNLLQQCSLGLHSSGM
jgi:hypothetical protein